MTAGKGDDRLRLPLERYRVTNGRHFDPAAHPARDPDCMGLDKKTGQVHLRAGVKRLAELQSLLYASGTWSVLMVLQAMDTGGKDGVIRHVMSGVNPQGVSVSSFRRPGPVELAHDYLWREHIALPGNGRIGIFNRGHYEEVLVTRVHPELLDAQKIPPSLRGASLWEDRFHDIRNFEAYLGNQGVVVLKFFLNISREEQRRRLLKRIDHPEKNWKFSSADMHERGFWNDYQKAYHDAIQHTATERAPWIVVPADRKWFARLVVVEFLIDALERLHLSPPAVTSEEQQEMKLAREKLMAEKPRS